ncbi:MAG: class I SAM-dependent methyltransferase [Pseudomonadota bacterium]
MLFERAFDGQAVVDAYEGRPLYDDKVIRLLFDSARMPGGIIRDGDVLADIGCGQGRFLSSLFASHSFQTSGVALSEIHAVDPSPNMLEALQAKFRERNNLKPIEGRFQDIPLEDHSVDVAVCASSLHWGCITEDDAEKTASELARILKADGRLVLLSDAVSQKPGVNKEIFDLKRAPEIAYLEKYKFGHYTYNIMPRAVLQAVEYWNYEASPREIAEEYASQVYIYTLPDHEKAQFYDQLGHILYRHRQPNGSIALERGCAVVAGPYPCR